MGALSNFIKSLCGLNHPPFSITLMGVAHFSLDFPHESLQTVIILNLEARSSKAERKELGCRDFPRHAAR